MYVPRAMYSFKMSFWMVPRIFSLATPCSSATNWYRSSRIAPVALMVMDVVTLSIGRSAIRSRMSARESIATPTFPTSPSARA